MSGSVGISQLPTEVLIMIMSCISDIQSFQSFVLTCHSIHDTYKDNQIAVLVKFLRHTIHVKLGVAVEADSCASAETLYLANPENKSDALVAFASSYRTRRAQQLGADQSFQDPKRIFFPLPTETAKFTTRNVEQATIGDWPARDLEYLLRLVKRHLVLEKCINRFLCMALAVHPHDLESNHNMLTRSKPLSGVEMQRLYRAFYRFDLHHLLIDKGQEHSAGLDYYHLLLLSCFPGHEIDEIGVVYQWLCDEWFNRIEALEDIKLGDCANESYWTGEWTLRSSLITKGLQFFLQTVNQEESVQPQLIKTACAAAEPAIYIGSLLSSIRSIRECYRSGSADDGLPSDGTYLYFGGDHPDCPNFAWLWNNYYRMTTHFFQASDVDLRRIGFVIWDKERLDSWTLYNEPRSKSRPRSAMRER